MTFDEALEKYYEKRDKISEEFKADVKEWLKELGLDGKVRRKSDGKIGWLDVDYYKSLNFYPIRKDGTMAIRCSGWVSPSEPERDFERYEDDSND